MPAAWLFLHLAGVTVWVGGMFFAHFALRPAAEAVLEPPLRLALMQATLARFFLAVTVSVVAVLVSGLALFVRVPIAQAPPGWHAMLALGVVMALVFAYIRLALFARLRRSVAASAWPAAAQSLRGIRQLVAFNLALGTLAIVAAVSPRL